MLSQLKERIKSYIVYEDVLNKQYPSDIITLKGSLQTALELKQPLLFVSKNKYQIKDWKVREEGDHFVHTSPLWEQPCQELLIDYRGHCWSDDLIPFLKEQYRQFKKQDKLNDKIERLKSLGYFVHENVVFAQKVLGSNYEPMSGAGYAFDEKNLEDTFAICNCEISAWDENNILEHHSVGLYSSPLFTDSYCKCKKDDKVCLTSYDIDDVIITDEGNIRAVRMRIEKRDIGQGKIFCEYV